jgi:dUTP pyrophosphatase
MLEVKIKRIHPDAIIPTYTTEDSAGYDIYTIDNLILQPNQAGFFHTGIQMEISSGYVGLIWDRSGMAKNDWIHRLAGVIDSDYREKLELY